MVVKKHFWMITCTSAEKWKNKCAMLLMTIRWKANHVTIASTRNRDHTSSQVTKSSKLTWKSALMLQKLSFLLSIQAMKPNKAKTVSLKLLTKLSKSATPISKSICITTLYLLVVQHLCAVSLTDLTLKFAKKLRTMPRPTLTFQQPCTESTQHGLVAACSPPSALSVTLQSSRLNGLKTPRKVSAATVFSRSRCFDLV